MNRDVSKSTRSSPHEREEPPRMPAAGGQVRTPLSSRPDLPVRRADEEETIKLREERLTARKERLEVGEVLPHRETIDSEEVCVGKRAVKDTERVSGTAKKETLRVEHEGDFEIVGGEGQRAREHRWIDSRCETCGATRRQKRAA